VILKGLGLDWEAALPDGLLSALRGALDGSFQKSVK
jgi:hypothetical protein